MFLMEVKKMRNNRNQTKRVLPGLLSDSFRTLAVEMRRKPRPQSNGKGTDLMVYDGLATVMNAEGATFLEEGMMFKLKRRTVSAKKVEVKPGKFRGSGNHNKFLVVIHDGVISQGAVQ